jgi:hypothetical protein
MPGGDRPVRSPSNKESHIPSVRAVYGRAWDKDRPVVSYVDLRFGGVPMINPGRSTGSAAPTKSAP